MQHVGVSHGEASLFLQAISEGPISRPQWVSNQRPQHRWRLDAHLPP